MYNFLDSIPRHQLVPILGSILESAGPRVLCQIIADHMTHEYHDYVYTDIGDTDTQHHRHYNRISSVDLVQCTPERPIHVTEYGLYSEGPFFIVVAGSSGHVITLRPNNNGVIHNFQVRRAKCIQMAILALMDARMFSGHSYEYLIDQYQLPTRRGNV